MKIFLKSTAPTPKLGIFSDTFESGKLEVIRYTCFRTFDMCVRYYAPACVFDLQIGKINEMQRYLVEEIECCSHSRGAHICIHRRSCLINRYGWIDRYNGSLCTTAAAVTVAAHAKQIESDVCLLFREISWRRIWIEFMVFVTLHVCTIQIQSHSQIMQHFPCRANAAICANGIHRLLSMAKVNRWCDVMWFLFC